MRIFFQKMSALAIVAIFAVSSLAGCAFTKMETARQLDSNEFVFSGSADWPGFLFFIPRVQGNAMYGFGVGDVSVHAGTAFFLYNAGLGTRLYLSDWVNLSMQADAQLMLPGTFSISEADRERTMGFLTLTPRLTTSAEKGRSIYGGVQSNLILAGSHEPDQGWESESGEFIGLGGLVGGVDYLFESNGLGVQAELIFYPLGFSPSEGISFLGRMDDPGSGFPALGQVSLGAYYRPKAVRGDESMEPSRYREDDPTPRDRLPPQRDSRPEETPDEQDSPERDEPDYDDDGVPVY